MNLKFANLTNLTLLVALALSTVAAYYSIIGLTAIFAGAVIPVIIMGSILEVGKITTTVWLRKYWDKCGFLLKLYLVPAVVALALLTSMGIFGFLSKAHMDQGITSSDVQSKIALYDEKIKTEKENIEATRKALKQMDEGVDQVLGRSTDEKGADKAVALRRSQQKERVRLQNEISQSQKSIAELNDARAPIAAEVRKVEAEVGPIKYIAALIYGDNTDQNMLESAVRWVIILLVIVFDPLAIALVLAANQSKVWDKEKVEEMPEEKPIVNELEEDSKLVAEANNLIDDIEKPEPEIDVPMYEPDDGALTANQIEQVKESAKFDFSKHPYLNEKFAHFVNLTPMPSTNIEAVIPKKKSRKSIKTSIVESLPAVPTIEVTSKPVPTLPYTELDGGYVLFDGKHMHKDVLVDMRPDLFKNK